MAQWIDCEQMLAVYHVGDKKLNPHTHFVIKMTKALQKQSMALRLKPMFGLETSNKDYALDVWDGDTRQGATGYLFHEENVEILVNKGVDASDIEAARVACAAVQKVVAINKEKASVKLVDKALEHFEGKRHVTKQDILMFMGKRIIQGESYFPGSFGLKKMVEEVELKRCKSDDEIEMWAINQMNNLWS